MTGEDFISGPITGFADEVTALHRDYYAENWDFGPFFADRVHAEAGEFAGRFNPAHDGVWSIVRDGKLAASLTIDGHDRANAHLRWFIIDERLRGTGIGNRLMRTAVEFCDARGFERVYLTTFAGLDAARHLYEKFGFVLVASARAASWGTEVVEQRFERVCNRVPDQSS